MVIENKDSNGQKPPIGAANITTEESGTTIAHPIGAAATALRSVKLVHTVIWAFFAVCILAIPFFALVGRYKQAIVVISVILFEVLVLAFNGWRCPLTNIAARHTDDRRDNFDIYLPEWLAHHNKLIFGILYVVGILLTVARAAHILPR